MTFIVTNGSGPVRDGDMRSLSVSERRASVAPVVSRPEPSPLSPDADAEIVEALSRNDTRLALELCSARYGESIGRLCMAMLGSQGDADDVTQQTLLVAHRRFAELGGETSLHAWLLGIARHESLRQLEKKRRRAAAPSPPPNQESDGYGGEAVQRREEGAARARALLERVRPSEREALLLRFVAGLSFEEVAAALGSDEQTERRRVSQALLRLRSSLGSDDADD